MKQLYTIALCLITFIGFSQNNPDFYVAPNGETCMCPDAEFGDTGSLTINGETKTYTKRSRAQLDALIAAVQYDPQIALTCTSGITDMSQLFYNKVVFNQNINSWDVSNVTKMGFMFFLAESFNQPINNWDVSNVTEMQLAFYNASSFNQSIDNWDVSNVLHMHSMFDEATSFDQPLNSWNVSNVTNMNNMFSMAESFNQSIDNWNVSNVTDMSYMFSTAKSFNQPLNSWDVSNVTNMNKMFSKAESFNQPLDNWNVSNVTDMINMFSGAQNFNQDLESWTFNTEVDFPGFLSYSGLNSDNYDALLQSFDAQNLTNKSLGANILPYCNEAARLNLINNKSWIIDGDIPGVCGDTLTPSTTPIEMVFYVDYASGLDISFFTNPNFPYDYNVDWGDGTSSSNINGDINHYYNLPGQYTVSITGIFPNFRLCENYLFNGYECDNASKIIDVTAWGNQEWLLTTSMFRNANNLNFTATDTPDFSKVTNMERMFRGALQFNSDISDWDVSNVSDMTHMFALTEDFNQPLNNWDVFNVSAMSSMFTFTSSFNQPLDNWDVSNVIYMDAMFNSAQSFNQPLDNWDVSNVISMAAMFEFAQSFDQPLNNWDVSKVTNMNSMFLFNENFNQPLNNWNVSSVIKMGSMFNLAESFDQPLNNWDVSNVTYMRSMFNGAVSFNQDISSWCVEQILEEPISFSSGSSLQENYKPNWGVECENLSVNLLTFESSITVYPNPVKNSFDIELNDNLNISEISIYNINGQLIDLINYQSKPINISSLESGVYMLKIKAENGDVAYKRIIKR
ncbi:hypothetical protein CAP47_03730 [Psychroflexus sp. S27]|uniref:BspA family leucine-rich repeat surface protein n=1 Tax=Psychroflexus sp. S27 TaxID=1982757 RepID=UPI000C2A647C|nr:BspA family leucine-rich repeat surface protein [Psychroflexus sp. S27]PJX24603.1 hypothetical protein CAP47_03730 [Psychroflexus sp. S27]